MLITHWPHCLSIGSLAVGAYRNISHGSFELEKRVGTVMLCVWKSLTTSTEICIMADGAFETISYNVRCFAFAKGTVAADPMMDMVGLCLIVQGLVDRSKTVTRMSLPSVCHT